MLSENMHGNYTILCGNCKHHHYRVIKNGVVTEDRHSKSMGAAELIHVMPSACSKEKRQRGVVAQLREKFAAGFGTGGE